ncbi:MAG TPA: CsbD family protein [Pyrinomonadaceae bacterium]|nr:CsbD family protein [Pyrinomonadaceae bacterium]
MGLPNSDEVEGKVDQVKGRAKEEIGDITNDDRMRGEGRAEHAGGELQEGFGTARRKVGETIEDIGDAIRGR